MRGLIYFLLLNFAGLTLSNSTTENYELKEMEYREGTSVEPRYSLPSVKIGDSSENPDNVVPASLQRVLDFYNSENLMVRWPKFKSKITKECQKDMEAYIDGLRNTENWALKMEDASGRYSTGWFWGNHYWLGSKNLCDNIEPLPNGFTIKNRTRVVRTASAKKYEADSPSQAVGYQKGPLVHTSVPPFSVSFYMLRVDLNSSFTTEERVLSIGLCLPYICRDEDVKTIMEETSAASDKVEIDVLSVKSHHNRYNIMQDRTFLALCVATVFMACCLTVGTLFDYYLEYQKSKQVTTITQRFSVPSLKSTNGLILREFLLSFSVRANLKTICDQSVGSDTIPVLHGLKSISMAWVILGHTCIVAFKYSDNMEYRKVVQKEFWFQTISNGAFSVDTFFFTSGLLVSFLYFRTNAKGKLDPLSKGKNGFVAGLFHFMGLMCYRLARLSTPYVFSLGVTEVTMKWFYYNSVFEPPTQDHINCPNYWWRNVLYINTLFPVNEMCMLWSWYISDDTQFYAVGAIILILATSHFKSAAALLVIFSASSWLTTGYIAYSNSHVPGSDDPLALFDKIYDKPWTRLGPYLIGMCVGWLLFKKDCRIPMSKITITIGWLSSLGLLLALVYGLYEANLSPVAGAAYSSLSHSAWAIGLAWIVVACVTGYGGIINKILSLPVLYPFSRVTYCAYLVHPLLIRGMVMSMDSPLHLGRIPTIIIFMGQAVASYILSFVLSLAFEAPAVSMLRIISKVVAHKKQSSRV
ncbi:nose resistant to fluoxetine protein 6 isoform X2 [Anthonomus grandis grandis]|uniref:nose resistant to fluoxetine protein 6 isoform X2 n=1 Tax=Anthonomus grandis grandis TaxID=2921223 RepID=UPI0021650FE9|nr:nose resistant to fluoxetine protein 6 isoform X2 [Anthonomus grandis grandis]